LDLFSILPLRMNLREKILKLQENDEWYVKVKLEIENEVMKIPSMRDIPWIMMDY
jgi:hypothetical protein